MPVEINSGLTSDNIEESSGAELDYETYLQSKQPLKDLIAHLGTTKAEMRAAVHLPWSAKQLGDRECVMVADILQSQQFTANAPVKMVSLDNNRIGDNGLAVIADAIMLSNSVLANVKTIWLNNNCIGDVGVAALAKALKVGSLARLQKLYLHDNNITDEGALAIADAIQNGKDLVEFRFLFIQNNSISQKGHSAIDKAAAKFGRIQVTH